VFTIEQSRLRAADALAHVERLCQCGDRFVGQPGDAEALAYIRECFVSYGLDVEETPIAVPTFRQLEASVTLSDGKTIEGLAPYFSPSSNGAIEAEAVFVGGGEEEDYRGLDVGGKIAVLEESGLGFSRFWLGTFAARARDKGARGMIVLHPMPWSYRMSMESGNSDLAHRFDEPRIPVVAISANDGFRLMRDLGHGSGRIRLLVRTELGDATSACIAGVVRGKEMPDERVIIMSHRDHGIPPGANDNGAGTGTMLELSRLLANAQARRSLVFLSTTAEEGVTPGAAQYVASLGDKKEDVRAVFDLDMFAVGGRLNLVDEGRWPDREPLHHTPWLLELVETVTEELGFHVGRMTATWGVAESGRFLEAGVPAVWFWKPDDPYYHSPHDSPEKLDANLLKIVGDITMEAALRVANGH
jgi:aminopeptidase YwaD